MSETTTPQSDLTVDPKVTAPAPSPEPAPTLHVEQPPVAQEAKPEPAFEAHTEKPTLLETAAPKPEPEVKVEPEKAPEVKPEPAPEPAPVAYEFNLPEGFTARPEEMNAYTGVLKETGIAPDVGQKLLDMHINAVQQMAQSALGQQHAAFRQMRDGWVNEVMADPQLGGAGHRTAITAAARGRDMLLSDYTPEQRTEFEQFLRTTGAGDHPAFLRLLYSAARYFDEPALPPENPKPPPDNGRPNGRGARVLYDHPRSNANRQ